MSTPDRKVETAREDLIIAVALLIGALLTSAIIGAVVWNNLDKFLSVIGFVGIWSGIGVIIYAVKSEIW